MRKISFTLLRISDVIDMFGNDIKTENKTSEI